jgi:hypothetical protein
VREEVSGVFAYSPTFGPLGLAFDQVLNFSGANNRLDHTVTPPFIGVDFSNGTTGASAKGAWISAMHYYDGVGIKGNGMMASLGNLSLSLTQMETAVQGGLWRDGAATGGANLATESPVAAAGWYITTHYFYNEGANHTARIHVQNLSAVRAVPAAGNISPTNFNALRLGDRAGTGLTPDENFDELLAWVAFGRGDPADAHAWAYNNGVLRKIDEYDFASDAAASIDVFIPLYRVSPGNTTFSASEVIDTIGGYDSWTLSGTLAWANRAPGFINPAGDPPVTPPEFIFPRIADTSEANLTFCVNTKNIGAAVAGDFTITALTHSGAGNIAGTVTGTTFPNPGAGTITGTVNGRSVACEIVQELALPAYKPNFADRYAGNARAAGIENYTTPGAGTTYGTVAALKAAIDALGSGGTLIIADANLTGGGALTLTAKNYGVGATLVCTNRHGLVLDSVTLTGVSNLTIRGFKTIGKFTGGSGVNGVTLDHCTGSGVEVAGNTGATETFTLSNWIGPDDGTEDALIFSKFNRLVGQRFAHGRADNDILRVNNCNTAIFQRFFVGDNESSNPAGHYDSIQIVGSGTQGFVSALFLNGVMIHVPTGGEISSQGLSNTQSVLRHVRVKNCAIRSSLTATLSMDNADQGISYQNVTGSQRVDMVRPATRSAFVDNIVKSSAGTVLPSTGAGAETNVDIAVMPTAYPQWISHEGTWEQWDNPATGYDTKGAGALIAALAANKASYP